MNLIITAVPHGDEAMLHTSIDTGTHGLLPQRGHLGNPELIITIEYRVARELFLNQDPGAVGQAFSAGKIMVEGDISRIFLLQKVEATNDDEALTEEVSSRLVALTA